MKKLLLLIGLVALVNASVFAKDIDYFRGSWLCIEDQGVGYTWNRSTSEWDEVSNFKKSKFIFKTFNDDECRVFKEEEKGKKICADLYRFGDEPSTYWLSKFDYWERSEFNLQAYISGWTLVYEFKMSERGKFIRTFN